MSSDISAAEISPVEGEQSTHGASGDVCAHEGAAADEVAACGADKTEHHHVGEEMLVLDVTEDVEDALDGARVAGDVHEVAG